MKSRKINSAFFLFSTRRCFDAEPEKNESGKEAAHANESARGESSRGDDGRQWKAYKVKCSLLPPSRRVALEGEGGGEKERGEKLNHTSTQLFERGREREGEREHLLAVGAFVLDLNHKLRELETSLARDIAHVP